MASKSAVKYTKNQFFDVLRGGETNVMLTGYVDSIDCVKEVTTFQKQILKFLLNNTQGRRIAILIWSNQISKFESKVKLNRILTITRGSISAVKAAWRCEGVVPYEFHVQKETKFIEHGDYQVIRQLSTPSFKEERFGTVVDAEGSVCLKGYIQETFIPVTIRNSNYGSGTIVDGSYRLPVHISQFVPQDGLDKGVCVKVYGTIDTNKLGGHHFTVPDMAHIVIQSNETPMPEETMEDSFLPITKRCLPSDNENLSVKRVHLGESGKDSDENDTSDKTSHLKMD